MTEQSNSGFQGIVRRWQERGAPVDGPFWDMLGYALKGGLPIALLILAAAAWEA